MNQPHQANFIHPRNYFSQGFLFGGIINPDLLGKYARSSANILIKDRVSTSILENCYYHLFQIFDQEKHFNNVEDLSDIMRASSFVEPFINYPFLLEIIDAGLLSVTTEIEIEAFFLHLKRVIEICDQKKNSSFLEY